MLLVGGTVARLGHGVTIVAWVLLIRAVGGSYTEAGLVAGTISLATAFAAPVAGRLVDRYSAARVVPLYALVYTVGQLCLLCTVLLDGPTTVLLVFAGVTGAGFPPMSPSIRAAWTHLTDGGPHAPLRSAAMAAESTVFELVFVAGPLIVSLCVLLTGSTSGSATFGTAVAIGLASISTLVGTLVVCRGCAIRALRRVPESPPTVGVGPLRIPRFVLLLTVTAGVALSFGAAPVAITAFTENGSETGGVSAGVLIAVWSAGSAAGGLAYGLLSGACTTRELLGRLVAVLLVLGTGYGLWQLATGPVVMGAFLLVTGAVIAPATTILAELVAVTVPRFMLTEGYTWFTCANMSSAALGAAVAGRLVDTAPGVRGAFWACALAVAFSCVVAVATMRRADHAPDSQSVTEPV